jgi:hypothetical protein
VGVLIKICKTLCRLHYNSSAIQDHKESGLQTLTICIQPHENHGSGGGDDDDDDDDDDNDDYMVTVTK